MMSADYTSQHFVAVAFSALFTLLLTFVVISQSSLLGSSRGVILVAFVCIAIVTLSYRRSMHRWSQADNADRAVLFLGDREACRDFRAVCGKNGLGHRVICAVTGELTTPPIQIADVSSMPDYRTIMTDIKSGRLEVEAVVIRESGPSMPEILTRELTQLYFQGVPTYTLELFFETYWRKIPLYRINHIWLFLEGFEIARTPVFERDKRALDVLLAACGLLVTAPVLALVSVAIKLTDPGPVLFWQTRVGRNREPFRIVKLRTMRSTPPPAEQTPTMGADFPDTRYTQTEDPRITRIGHFLRKTRLDEVPQLWNVLKGEMSLIGPRAEWDALVTDYEAKIPCYHFRHLVRPGITGWAQINYPYGASVEDTLRKLEYDLYYIRHFSFVMDAAIVLRTVHLMLFGKGR